MHHSTTTRTTPPLTTLKKALCLVELLTSGATVFAAPPDVTVAPTTAATSAQDIQARYERERSACVAGRTNQDQATCLREAGAARDDARRGLTQQVDRATLQRNAVDRCKTLPTAEQSACQARITGDGLSSTSGSVQGGGVLREHVEIIPPATPSTVPPAPAKPSTTPNTPNTPTSPAPVRTPEPLPTK